jgi:hypothetical protein
MQRTLTCFLRSWGRLKALPQKSHLCGFKGTWTRMCEVMWSRFTVVVRQVPQAQVKFKLFVLLRPTCRSQIWSCVMISFCSDSSVANSRVGEFGATHIELLWRGRALCTPAPLALEKLILCYLLRSVLRLGGGRSRERLLLFRCRHLRALGASWPLKWRLGGSLGARKGDRKKGTESSSQTTTMRPVVTQKAGKIASLGGGKMASGVVLRRG